VVLTGAYGEIVQSDKEAVVLRMDSWPSGSKAPDTPVIPYSRFYPDKEVIYSVATKHFNDLLANKKVKAGDIERVYVVNKKYWDDVLWGQRIIFPEGESFRSYADLLSGDIIHRNDQVVIFRLDEKYCHCRGDKDLGIKDRWHEGFLVLHMGQQVQNSLMYPLPENRLKEFMPKGEAGNRD
jgi:hypothetical protein